MHHHTRHSSIRRRAVLVTAVGAAVTVGLLPVTAQAAEPAERACLGEFFSDSATSVGVFFGQDVRFFAQNADQIGLRNLGEGIGVLQAGESVLFPDTCQPD